MQESINVHVITWKRASRLFRDSGVWIDIFGHALPTPKRWLRFVCMQVQGMAKRESIGITC